MPSKVDLVSSALVLIGDVPVNNLTGSDRRQVVANQLFERVKQGELAKFPWGFARKRAQLSLTTEEPTDNEWQYIYQLPTDLITLIKIYPRFNYRILGDKLYANTNTEVHAEYVYDIAEEEFPVHFSRVIEYALAVDFSVAIREDNTTRQLMAELYANQSRMARAMDSQQNPNIPFQDKPFVNVRY